MPEIIASLDSLDDHLAYRTFLVGHDLTASDFLVWGAIKGTPLMPHKYNTVLIISTGSLKIVGLMRNGAHTHLARWASHIESLESTQSALAGLTTPPTPPAAAANTAGGIACMSVSSTCMRSSSVAVRLGWGCE